MRQSRFQRHVAATGRPVIVMRLPTVDANARATYGRVRCHAPLDGRGINEGFESGARLAIRLEGIVELVRQKVIAADHRNDFAGLRVQGHHRALHGGDLDQLDLQMMSFLINLFDFELSQIARFEFSTGRALAPTHPVSAAVTVAV